MSASFLRASRVEFSYGFGEPVLAGVDFQPGPGWTGVVGPNGAGKTTLLRLLSGELSPSAGTLTGGPGLLCAQTVEALDEGVRALALAPSAGALRDELGLRPLELSRWETLSPGERKRWQIGAALFVEPGVLLLDEPTNHLDAAARAWLVSALHGFPGVGVVVSHDRALLDELTLDTLRVAGGTARLYTGGYSQARPSWEAEESAARAEREALGAREQALRARLAEARREQQSASASRSVRGRMRSKHDSDARTLGAQTLADWAEKRASRGVQVLRRAHEKAASAARSVQVAPELGGALFAGYERCPRPWIARLGLSDFRLPEPEAAPERGEDSARGGRAMEGGPTPAASTHAVDEGSAGAGAGGAAGFLAIGREDRVWLSGPNGAGKTTLLRALLEAAALPPGRALVLPQDLSSDEAAAALDDVRALPPRERGKVLTLVATLGVEPGRLLASGAPSPGEARKLLLARGLALNAWALFLDEPTNHLDLPSIERLEAALREWPGALLLVTHDERLAAALTTRRVRLEAGRVFE